MLHSHGPQPRLVPHAAECWSSNLAGQAVASDVHGGEIAENVSLTAIAGRNYLHPRWFLQLHVR